MIDANKNRKCRLGLYIYYNWRSTSLLGRHTSNDVRITWVGNAETADPVVLSAGGTKLNVVARVVVNASLGEHGVILDLTLPERRGVVGNDDELGLPLPQSLNGLLVAEDVLARLHHQR